MTLKELSQLYWLKKEIKSDEQRLETLRSMVPGTTGSGFSDMPKGRNHNNQIEKYTEEIDELNLIILSKKRRCIYEQKRLEYYIQSIPDSLTRQIFTLRFIECLSWVRVAFSIGGYYTADSVKKICYRYIKNNEK